MLKPGAFLASSFLVLWENNPLHVKISVQQLLFDQNSNFTAHPSWNVWTFFEQDNLHF